MRVTRVLGVVVMSLLLSLPVAAAPAPPPPLFEGMQATNSVCVQSSTGSTEYQDIPGMSVVFTAQQQHPAIIIANLEVRIQAFRQGVHLRLLLDDVPVASDIQLAFVFAGDASSPVPGEAQGLRSLQFLTAPVVGTHTVRLQWRLQFDQIFTPICVFYRSLIVAHL